MERLKGQRGKQGETDQQIVFTLLHNQPLKPDGLTKKEISVVIEKATSKDREGIRKRLDRLLSIENSPLKGMIHSNNRTGKTRYEIKARNLKDLARLYNFLHPDSNMMYVLEGHFLSDLYASINDVIDYLYLWDLEDPLYGLPDELLKQWNKEDKVEFYPRYYPTRGPVYLKERAIKFRVLEERWGIHDGIGQRISDQESLARFFNLIENFDSYVNKECQGTECDVPMRVLEAFWPPKPAVSRWEELPGGLMGIERDPVKISEIGDSLRWFMEIWKERWDQVINEGFPVRKYDTNVSFPRKEDVAMYYGVPIDNVNEDGDSHYNVKVPESFRPVIPEFIYPQVKFCGDHYELRVDRSLKKENRGPDEQKPKSHSEEIEGTWNEPDFDTWIQKWTMDS